MSVVVWDEVGAVAWAELKHNYGRAEDVPALLRLCADPDAEQAGDALDELDNLIYHQGGWICSAACATLPFLLRLAADKSVAHRVALVELVGRIAREATIADPRFVDPAWPDVLAHAVPRMLELLADPDPQVRREATLMVATGGLPYHRAATALWQRWHAETDPVTRWDLVQALGAVVTKAPAGDPLAADIRTELLRLLEWAEDLQLRLAAAHALSEAEPALVNRHVDVLVEAVRDEVAEGWQRSAWIGGERQTIIHCTGRLLRLDPVVATAFTVGVSRGGERDQRVATMDQAGQLLADWRSLGDALLPFLVDHLEDREAEIRYRAAFLLGCLGAEAAPYADRLATLVDDQSVRDSRLGYTVSDAVVWALARLHDDRCLPGLVQRLSGPRLGFDTRSSHIGRDVWMCWQPGIHEVLIPLSQYAGVLLDAVIHRLESAARQADQPLTLNLCHLLAAWGPLSEPAVPMLLRLLRRDEVWVAAAKALGGIGHAPIAAGQDLRERVEQRTSGSDAAAWALWRTSGDPEPGLGVLLGAVADEKVRHPTLKYLGDFGSLAAATTDRLRQLIAGRDEGVRVEAARALWRVTGDTTQAVPTLTTIVEPLTEGTCRPVMRTAMCYLAEMGEPGAAAVAVANAVLDNPRRLAYFGSWRTFTEDEELCAAAASLLNSTG